MRQEKERKVEKKREREREREREKEREKTTTFLLYYLYSNGFAFIHNNNIASRRRTAGLSAYS
jgi:hypothetical protein